MYSAPFTPEKLFVQCYFKYFTPGKGPRDQVYIYLSRDPNEVLVDGIDRNVVVCEEYHLGHCCSIPFFMAIWINLGLNMDI